jgi:hypothetical protein
MSPLFSRHNICSNAITVLLVSQPYWKFKSNRFIAHRVSANLRFDPQAFLEQRVTISFTNYVA